ncbi:MAG: hypothetical protein ACYCY7_00835 [Gallionella sp.]
MNNSFTFRPWLTVRETAKMLSRELGHEITESDIFSYALTHKLTLSVNFAGALTGIFGHYDKKINGDVGIIRFKPSTDVFNGALRSEQLDLELTYCHVGRGIVDHIYKKLLGLPAVSLPDEGNLAINTTQSKYNWTTDKSYFCYGTVFMVHNVSYNHESGMLLSRRSDGTTVEGGFIVGAAAIQEFIRQANEPENIKIIPELQTQKQGGEPVNTNGHEWKKLSHAKADEIYRREKKMNCEPSDAVIAKEIEKIFDNEKILSVKGKRLTRDYIKRHGLEGWKRPQS